MATISQPRIAFGVGVTLFVACLLLGFVASYPPADAGASEWTSALAKTVIVAAIGSTALVGFLALLAAGVWVWFRTMVAFGRVPHCHVGWIFIPAGLSEEGKAARIWLLRVYGVIALMGVTAYALQRMGVL
jgi:hypothetical protein